jgi:hypothetical protein
MPARRGYGPFRAVAGRGARVYPTVSAKEARSDHRKHSIQGAERRRASAPRVCCATGPGGTSGEERLNTLVWEQVLHALGEPHNLFWVQIFPLRDRNYRMNVYVGTNAANFKIPYSYFVEADDDGMVLSSSPPIHKLYLPIQEK